MSNSRFLLLAALAGACGKQGEVAAPVASPPRAGPADAAPAASDAGSSAVPGDADVAELDQEVKNAAIIGVLTPIPTIVVRPEWRACDRGDKCIAVYGDCSIEAVVVNERSKEAVRAAWEKACEGKKAKRGAFLAEPEYVCRDGVCEEELAGLGGGSRGGGKAADPRSPDQNP